jgi:2-phosphoglycerate kinase
MSIGRARAPDERHTVLLIGGSAGVGKTVLAEQLAAHFAMPLVMADDFRLFGQRITTATQLPALHFFIDASSAARRASLTPEDTRDRLSAVGDLVSHGLEIVIGHHLALQAPLLIEGDAITPALAAAGEFAAIPAAGRVKSIFLHEPDESKVLSNMLARGRGIELQSGAEQARGARAAWLHGETLAAEARRLGLPVVISSPFDTLYGRALRAI